MKAAFILSTLASVTLVSADDCLAAGKTDSQGRYSCNPAHQYPDGQTCDVVDGCYYLSSGGKPVKETGSAAQPTQTATCAAPGTTDSQGRYSCNPAHQYPNGQTCDVVDGCLYLCANGKPIRDTSTGTGRGQPPTQTGISCLATGSIDRQSRYSCNPAHQYPSGQICSLIDGCYYLCANGKPIQGTPTGKPIQGTPTGNVQHPAPSGSLCPAPGSVDRQSRYSCNPAHQYPSGQTCKLMDGCYFLSSSNGKPIQGTGTPSSQPPVVTAGAAPLEAAHAGMLVLAALGAIL